MRCQKCNKQESSMWIKDTALLCDDCIEPNYLEWISNDDYEYSIGIEETSKNNITNLIVILKEES